MKKYRFKVMKANKASDFFVVDAEDVVGAWLQALAKALPKMGETKKIELHSVVSPPPPLCSKEKK